MRTLGLSLSGLRVVACLGVTLVCACGSGATAEILPSVEAAGGGLPIDPGVIVDDSDAGAPEPDAGPPDPAPGGGVWEPATSTLHDYRCAGLDWQIMNHWIVIAHKAPEVGDNASLGRCIDRYAGWVSNDSDAAKVSRASIYAALEASGACDEGKDYAGIALSPALCAKIHPELNPEACASKLESDAGFGVALVAAALSNASYKAAHKSDPVLMGALLGHGSVACGGADRWKLQAPEGWLDRYTKAYNAARETQEGAPAACGKRLIASFALYTGLGNPGANGVAKSNACWTYERVSKENPEWKLCNYDGTVHHASGSKWAYDDTNSSHNASTEASRISACRSGVPGRGYIYMTNRGSGWKWGASGQVRVHFAEIYSDQSTVDDQYYDWVADGKPGGAPMLNFGEAATTSPRIYEATLRACKQVKSGEYLGVYVYPKSLDGTRLTAFVDAMNACTKK